MICCDISYTECTLCWLLIGLWTSDEKNCHSSIWQPMSYTWVMGGMTEYNYEFGFDCYLFLVCKFIIGDINCYSFSFICCIAAPMRGSFDYLILDKNGQNFMPLDGSKKAKRMSISWSQHLVTQGCVEHVNISFFECSREHIWLEKEWSEVMVVYRHFLNHTWIYDFND